MSTAQPWCCKRAPRRKEMLAHKSQRLRKSDFDAFNDTTPRQGTAGVPKVNLEPEDFFYSSCRQMSTLTWAQPHTRARRCGKGDADKAYCVSSILIICSVFTTQTKKRTFSSFSARKRAGLKQRVVPCRSVSCAGARGQRKARRRARGPSLRLTELEVPYCWTHQAAVATQPRRVRSIYAYKIV